MIKKYLALSFLFSAFYNLNAQIIQKHNLALSFLVNYNSSEFYFTENGINKELRDTDHKVNVSGGLKYMLDLEKKYFFLRTGLDINYIELPPAVVDSYASFGIPVFGGLKLSRFKIFGGVTSMYNVFKFSDLNGTQINKELCLCELNYFQQIISWGGEIDFSKKIGFGFTIQSVPKIYKITEGIGSKKFIKTNQFHLKYQF